MIQDHLKTAMANIDNAMQWIKETGQSDFNDRLIKDLNMASSKIDAVSILVSN